MAVPPASPAHEARAGSRPRQRRARVSGDLPTNKSLRRSVAAVAAFCVPTLRQRRATPPRLAGRSRQTAALAAAAFEAASPSLSIWGGVGCRCRSWPLSVPARVARRHSTPRRRGPGPVVPGCRLATAVRRTPRGRTAAEAATHQRRRRPSSGSGCPGAPGPNRHRPHQRSQVLGALRPPTGNGSNGFPQGCPGCFFSREGCGGPLPLLPGRASYLCAGGTR